MKKNISPLVFSSLLVLGLSVFPSVHAQKSPDTVLVTEAFHSLLYLPVYVARSEGIFAQHDIEISSIRSAGSGPTALASVLANEAQFSVHGPEHVAFAEARGGRAKAVSAVANSAPVWVLARQQAEFSGIEDLRGKTLSVGLSPGTSNTLLKRWLSENDLVYQQDVRANEVQNGSELGPVLAGQADFAVAYQPQVEQGISQHLEIVHDFTDDYPEFAFSTINTSQQLIDTHPDLVSRFVASINQALRLIHENPEIAKSVAYEEFPQLDSSIVSSAVDRMISKNVYPPDALITREAIRNAIDMQLFVGNIEHDIAYEKIVDDRFFSYSRE